MGSEIHFHRRNLPQSKNKEEKYKNELRFFGKYDELLHSHGTHNYLNKKELADIVVNQIKYLDWKSFEVICYCIMPNHVHIVFTINEEQNDID